MANPYATEKWLRKELDTRTQALERCIDMLQQIAEPESRAYWTVRDVEAALDQARNAICQACRDGKPHTRHTRIV